MKTILCILDGFGMDKLTPSNPISFAKNWKRFLNTYPFIELHASGEHVGLPKGQVGNSKVGHMTIGTGQIIIQELLQINKMLENKALFEKIPKTNNDCHLMGLLSDGGVHSHIDHFIQMIHFLSKTKQNIFCHLFLDGRDTVYNSAKDFIKQLPIINNVKIATLSGRFFAMDRDNRMERTQKSFDAIVHAKGQNFQDVQQTIQDFYAQEIFDEFIPPCVNNSYQGIKEKDEIIMMNFRTDRVVQLLEFMKKNIKNKIFGMCDYGIDLPFFMPKPIIQNTLGEIISKNNMKQLRLAETEKYAHVTYFFNGGRNEPFPEEDRILIPSPKVLTYDLYPQMAAKEITNTLLYEIERNYYDFIVVNYANADMLGHTGKFNETKKSIIYLDTCLEQIEKKVLEKKWRLIITADHGNAECMQYKNGIPHTSHTSSLVPLMIIGGNHHPFGNGLSDIKENVLKEIDSSSQIL